MRKKEKVRSTEHGAEGVGQRAKSAGDRAKGMGRRAWRIVKGANNCTQNVTRNPIQEDRK